MPYRPVVLAICDGWGFSRQSVGNAIFAAGTTNFDAIGKTYPSTLLQASGKSVGLDWGELGNSEVGHLSLGAGRIVLQYSARIARAIETKTFFANETLERATAHLQKTSGSLHLIGLLTSGTVHASFPLLIALIDYAKQKNITKLYLHLFGDGKDSGLKEAPELLAKVRKHIAESGVGVIATFVGRNFSMDRDNNWDLTAQAYALFTQGTGEKITDLEATLQSYYAKGTNDNAIPPLVLDEKGIVKDGDAIVLFNFREDSIRQLGQMFAQEPFDRVPVKRPQNTFCALMTPYFDQEGLPVVFPAPSIKNNLAEFLSSQGLRQLHVAETQKYAHVTYFFNGLNNTPFPGEDDVLIESHKKAKEHPEMRAKEIADTVVEALQTDEYDFIVLNFANADILAHAGDLEGATKGAKLIDESIGRIRDAVLARNGIMIITSDHGNAESLVYKSTGDIETKHNANPVPFYLIAQEYAGQRTIDHLSETKGDSMGVLGDVAPTIVALMGLQKPPEMSGDSLLPRLF
ncbi:MAG: 2,3-bisphosphoglycerate-independent phosphoglycerate mutase [Candidatus Paceibacterota bacterium]|nr:MAG: 2,3-bisphosphoglycerate-independent phosphoglycerate mutase [Candidatus Paceibacterota bacterium]